MVKYELFIIGYEDSRFLCNCEDIKTAVSEFIKNKYMYIKEDSLINWVKYGLNMELSGCRDLNKKEIKLLNGVKNE